MIMGKDEGKVQGEQVSRHTQAGRLPEGATKRNAAADQPKTGDDDPHHAGVIVSPLRSPTVTRASASQPDESLDERDDKCRIGTRS